MFVVIHGSFSDVGSPHPFDLPDLLVDHGQPALVTVEMVVFQAIGPRDLYMSMVQAFPLLLRQFNPGGFRIDIKPYGFFLPEHEFIRHFYSFR
jgi:hypothetical protein